MKDFKTKNNPCLVASALDEVKDEGDNSNNQSLTQAAQAPIP
jgi:hypothetical protein